MTLNDVDFQRVCQAANYGMNKFNEIDYRITNAAYGVHWSITYIPKNNHFHWYIEDFGMISFTINNLGNIEYKKVNRSYQEGKTSVILIYSDYATGLSNWHLDDLRTWIKQKNTNTFPLQYYTNGC